MNVSPMSAPMPPDVAAKFVGQLGRAASDLKRARDAASTALHETVPVGVDVASGYAHRALSQLFASYTFAPPTAAASATRAAIESANAGLEELSRAYDRKAVSFDFVRDAWNDSIADIGRAQNAAKHDPSLMPVGDGS
jgi:hypothetical protein